MAMQFKKATKAKAKLRLALIGPSGAGKTYSALRIARGIGGRVAVIDTERSSASLYADKFEFDALDLDTFSPQSYVDAIHAAEAEGYGVLIIDSLSHAWFGKSGALEMVDNAAKRSQSKNSYTAWRDVTPQHNAMVDAIIQANLHIIVTMRAKTEYVLETDSRGKQAPRKVGLAPIQRDGLEYEFTVVGDVTLDNDLIISKTRYDALAGRVMHQPGEELGAELVAWLNSGSDVAPKPQRITQEQRLELGRIARQRSDAAGIPDWLAREYGFAGSAEITTDKFGAIRARLADPRPLAEPLADDDEPGPPPDEDLGDSATA